MKTDNELIAEFMGYPVYKTYSEVQEIPIDQLKPYYLIHQLDHDKSWNSLMPVVEKISLISTGDDDFFYPRTFGMRDADGNYMFRFNRSHLITAKTLIEAAHGAVVEFIKWYNSQPK